jgi:hypothetical protein
MGYFIQFSRFTKSKEMNLGNEWCTNTHVASFQHTFLGFLNFKLERNSRNNTTNSTIGISISFLCTINPIIQWIRRGSGPKATALNYVP